MQKLQKEWANKINQLWFRAQVQVVTLGLVSSNAASVFGQRWVSDAVASAPMVIMLVVRSCKL